MEKGFSRNTSCSEQEVKNMQAQTRQKILQSVFQVLQINGLNLNTFENSLEELIDYARRLLLDEAFWMALPNGLYGPNGNLIHKHTVRREAEIAVEDINADD